MTDGRSVLEQLNLLGHRRVNIVTSDKGWVLERLASELETRIHGIDINGDDRNDYDLTYYITYGARVARRSPCEVALFTHLEDDGAASAKFFSVAADVDACVAMSRRSENVLKEQGLVDVSSIKPGVDLHHFDVRLRIGVVGRTYHTGRKGEDLVRDILELPGVDWVFTGEGWPMEAQNIPESELPDFYRSLDYVLVPSLTEGGPMSVVEALACGVEVIAPDVGWVADYPHISFRAGDIEDLRRCLTDLLGKRRVLRESVSEQTWDSWARGHAELFNRLLSNVDTRSKRFVNASPEEGVSTEPGGFATVVLHGDEEGMKGGPSHRAPILVEGLRKVGWRSSLSRNTNGDVSEGDVVHILNAWPPESAQRVAESARAAGAHVVLSPILLDLREISLWNFSLPLAFSRVADPALGDGFLSAYRQSTHAVSGMAGVTEPYPGYLARMDGLFQSVDHLIFLSRHEEALAVESGLPVPSSSLVRNPVDADFWSQGDDELFAEVSGLDEYILCVGRIEPRKNQLMLAHAMRDTDIPVVFIGGTSPEADGHPWGQGYIELVERFGGPRVHFFPHIGGNRDLLRSAYRGARVVALPSWAEGASLAALEAAAAGATLVLGDRSGEPEYFFDWVTYCDPGDASSIRQAVVRAWDQVPDPVRRSEQTTFISSAYAWDRHVQDTVAAYQLAKVTGLDAPRRGGR